MTILFTSRRDSQYYGKDVGDPKNSHWAAHHAPTTCLFSAPKNCSQMFEYSAWAFENLIFGCRDIKQKPSLVFLDTVYDTLYDTLNDTLYNILYDTLYNKLYNTFYDTLYYTLHDTLYNTCIIHHASCIIQRRWPQKWKQPKK